MLERKVEKDIKEWIRNDDRALLVYGVRQAGKTFVIRKCLSEADCDYVEFNLIDEPEIVTILEGAASAEDLIFKLSVYTRQEITEGRTIIFFDEIQKYKDLVSRIKFLVDDKRYRYVMSGSLLGVELHNLVSAPVGYVRSIKMYPLDFEEFLQVFNVPGEVIEQVKEGFKSRRPLDEMIHKKLMELFELYIIIGGMPAAVEKYRMSDAIDPVINEHLDIISQYKLDFTQYEEESKKLIITDIYEKIPAELNEQSKRFKIADIGKNLRYEKMEESFVWLAKAGVAIPVYNVTQPVMPLMINEKRSLFKLFLSDTGMLTSIYGKGTKLKIITREKDINKGSVYENVIAQELLAHGFQPYYYSNKKKGELDFVVEDGDRIIPIEVKSGKDYKRHSALTNMIGSGDYGIGEGIVFGTGNLQIDGRIIYMPLYMVMAMQKDDVEFADISTVRYSW